jgi:hypothetical protein
MFYLVDKIDKLFLDNGKKFQLSPLQERLGPHLQAAPNPDKVVFTSENDLSIVIFYNSLKVLKIMTNQFYCGISIRNLQKCA